MKKTISYFYSWILLLATIVYIVFPTLLSQKEFSHRDIVYNYAPIRAWFSAQLRSGIFPYWDPFVGLGRLADDWTSIPVDLLSLIEVPFQLDYRFVLSLQLISIFLVLRWIFTRLPITPIQATMLTLLYALAPCTSYFLRYYMKGWVFLLYGALFVFLYEFLTQPRRSVLLGVCISTFLFTIGAKFEFVFTLLMTIALAYPLMIFSLNELPSHERWRRLIWGGLAMLAPILINYWHFSLITSAASSTLRLTHTAVDWSALLQSSVASVTTGSIVPLMLIIGLFCLNGRNSPSDRKRLIWAAIGMITFIVYSIGWLKPGYALGICFALLEFAWRHNGQKTFGINAEILLKAALLVYYFCRALPGDAEETRIIQWYGSGFKLLIGYLCATGLFHNAVSGLIRWSLTLMGVVFFYRSLGLVLLNYFAGIIWIPARDNFLIELPLALFTVLGWKYQTESSPRLAQWSRPTVAVFTLLFVVSHPFLEKPIKNKIDLKHFEFEWNDALYSEKLKGELDAWKSAFEYEPFGQVRILSYFHTFGRFKGIADADEYQSLASGRFVRYSTASRLGISYEDAGHLAATTGALSEEFKSILRPYPNVSNVSDQPDVMKGFYLWHILTAAPAFNCDHWRLFGIHYVEAPGGIYNTRTTRALMNGMYTRFGSIQSDEGLLPELQSEVQRCGLEERDVGERKFWRVPNALPRAYFLPNVTAAELGSLTPDDVVVVGDSISWNGRDHRWLPTNISKYSANVVQIHTDYDSPGSLVLADLYHPRWKATVNGNPDVIYPAFYLLRAIDLKKGPQIVQYTIHHPYPLRSIFGLLLGSGIILLISRRRF